MIQAPNNLTKGNYCIHLSEKKLALKDFASPELLETFNKIEELARKYSINICIKSFSYKEDIEYAVYNRTDLHVYSLPSPSLVFHYELDRFNHCIPSSKHPETNMGIFIVDSRSSPGSRKSWDASLSLVLEEHIKPILGHIKDKVANHTTAKKEVESLALDAKFLTELSLPDFCGKIKQQFDAKAKELADAEQKAKNDAVAKSNTNIGLFQGIVGTKEQRAAKPAPAGRA